MEDVQDGMVIKVSQPSTDIQIENSFKKKNSQELKEIKEFKESKERKESMELGEFKEPIELKNWKKIVILSQLPNLEYRVEIDPDEIPIELENQVSQLTTQFSKLKTCSKFKAILSNFIYRLDFIIKNKAEVLFEKLTQLLESNNQS